MRLSSPKGEEKNGELLCEQGHCGESPGGVGGGENIYLCERTVYEVVDKPSRRGGGKGPSLSRRLLATPRHGRRKTDVCEKVLFVEIGSRPR